MKPSNTRNALPPWLLLLLPLLVSCGSSTPALPKLANDAVILAFGDSLTRGTGAPDGEDYPAVLRQLTGRTVVNQGIPGEVSADGRARLPRVLDEVAPQLLILCHGGNDLLRKLPPAETAANLRAMIEEARGRGIPVVLIGVPKPGILLNSAEFYAPLAEEYQLPFDGKVLAKIIGDRALKSDAVHPNAAGYRKLAEAIQRLLHDAGAL